MAAAATATAATGLFSASPEVSDMKKTFAEAAAAPPPFSYWGWTQRYSTQRWGVLAPATTPGNGTQTAVQESIKTQKEEARLFEGQCLQRQLYKPKVPYPAWDYNWDGRMTEDTSLEGQIAGKDQAINNTKKTRHIILVRHGQYDEEAHTDAKQKLTPLGRKQAIKTGKRLAAMARGSSKTSDGSVCGPLPISKIRVSNMARAKETAQLIAREMQKEVSVSLERPDPTLNEAIPAPIIPRRPEEDDCWVEEEIDLNKDRVEEAFQKYFYRQVDDIEEDDDELDEFEVIVCHGNLIRYFFCRALQIPPEAWLRMSIYNCSMTYLTIRPNGSVSARMMGDIGHLDSDESSYSSLVGFKW